MKHSLIILFVLLLGAAQSNAQGKAKIIIKKNIDGEETIIEKEYDLDQGEDLSEVMREEDFEIEFDFDDEMMKSFFHFDFDDAGGHEFFNGGGTHGGGPFLGITQEKNMETSGVQVSRVIEESSAEAMGIESGDVIISFNGSDVSDMADIKRLISESAVGDEVKVEVSRNGKNKKLKGTLLEHPEMEQGMRWMQGAPDGEFEFNSQMNMAEMEKMMRQMEEQMQDMELQFNVPEGNMDEQKRKYQFHYDVPGRYHEKEGSGLRFDQVTSDDLAGMSSNIDLRLEDDLQLKGLRMHPLGGSSLFELEFSLAAAQDLSLTIYDSEAKMVYYEMLGDFSGEYTNVIDLNSRPLGEYYLQLAQDGKTFCRKVIKD